MIRNASISKTENPFADIDFTSPVYQEIRESLDIAFAQEFTRIAGKFVYCENDQEFAAVLAEVMKQQGLDSIFCKESKLVRLLESGGVQVRSQEQDFLSSRAGLTSCEYLIARLGSIMVSSASASGRRMLVYPDIHMVHAYTGQLVPDLQDALAGVKEKYDGHLPGLISVISGPSRTADIEKTLVMGAHGPRELYVFLVEKSGAA